MKRKVVITGGSGLIGKNISSSLNKNNFEVIHLSRSKTNSPYETYLWDYANNYIENGALDSSDVVIHLAGAGIADKRWSLARKKEIIESRVKTADLLYNAILQLNKKPELYISASAIGYYGAVSTGKIFTEDDPPGEDFQADVCKKWEHSAVKFNDLGIRTIIPRFGIVLSAQGGALKKMLLPTKLGVGSALGKGNQFFPWIHIDDISNIINHFIENKFIEGVFNLTTPSHCTYEEFSRTLAQVLGKPYFMPNVPKFVLKSIFGEMADIILNGSRISSDKLGNTGYFFIYNNLYNSLNNLLR